MADKYDLCPCGSGKKVKFCCKDLAPDIEKVSKLLESEQRAAALQHVDRVIEKHGPQPALMDLKITALIEMQQYQKAEEVVLDLLQANPDAPRPHALAAIMDVLKGNIDDAVKQLQRALQHLGDEDNPVPVFDALAMVSSALYEAGGPYETRAHLTQWLRWSGEQASERPLRMLLDLDAEIHPLLLVDLDEYEPPVDAPWREAYASAKKFASRGAWIAAAQRLREIAREVPDVPRLLQEYAYTVGKAGAREEMISALRDYAKLEGVDFSDAVEAEAIAQLLDVDTGATEVITMQFPIEDPEEASEKLLSSDACFYVDPSRMPRQEGTPPPKAVFIALSKPLQKDAEPSYENTPVTLGQINVFGRQTDREPLIEITGDEDDDFAAIKSLVEEVLGSELGDGRERTVVGGRNRINAIISPQLFFAPGVTPAQQFAIQSEMLEDRVLNVWPKTPNAHLGGQPPEDVAGDEGMKVRLAASLVLVEQSLILSQRRLDTAELRQRLQLPAIELPEEIDLDKIHRIDYSHIDVAKLDDAALMRVMQAGMVRARRLLAIEAVEEALNRKLYERDEDLTIEACYDLLARWHSSPSEQLRIVERAKESSEAGSAMYGAWLLRELVIRIESGEGAEAKQLIDTLTQQYSQHESVMQGLMSVLSRYGLLGAPPGMGPAPADDGMMSTSDVAVAMAREQQPEESSGLWTPDSGSPDQGGDDKPSGLWLPD